MVENKYYERKIKYLDLMEHGERVGGAGFVKTEVKGMDIDLLINVKGLHPTDTYERDVMLQAGDGEFAVGRIALKAGQGEFKYHMVMDHLQLQGIRIALGGIREIRCKWQAEKRAMTVGKRTVRENIIVQDGVMQEKKQYDKETPEEEGKDVDAEKQRGTKRTREIQLIPWDEIKAVEESLERVEKIMSRPAENRNSPTAQAAENRMGREIFSGQAEENRLERESPSGQAERKRLERESSSDQAEGKRLERESTLGQAERKQLERESPSGQTEEERLERESSLNQTERKRLERESSSNQAGEKRLEREDTLGLVKGTRPERGGASNQEAERRMVGKDFSNQTAERWTAGKDFSSQETERRMGWESSRSRAAEKSGRTGGGITRTGGRNGNMENRTLSRNVDRRTEKAAQGTLAGSSLGQGKKPVRLMEDKWQQIWAIYPHIKPFQDEREYLSISPADFVLLPDEAYRAANNSFLLHGYYNYDHLILTRLEKRGEVFYYIGVPGNYYEREKQVAIMFGFESFECGTEPAQAGDFGYYMMRTQL